MAAMRQSFDRTGNGVLCIRRRALVVDSLLEPLWQFESRSVLPAGLALVAVGGFGRKELFPCSDVDLLYLCADEKVEDNLRESIRGCNQAMWDLGLRASPMIRTLRECDRYDPDNIEFTLSLLDRRFIAKEGQRKDLVGVGQTLEPLDGDEPVDCFEQRLQRRCRREIFLALSRRGFDLEDDRDHRLTNAP